MHAAERAPAFVAMGELARSLEREGRGRDALTIVEYLQTLQPKDGAILRDLARLLTEQGRTLEAIQALCAAKAVTEDAATLIDDIRAALPSALHRFNAHAAANEVEQAEKYAAGLAALAPGNVALLNSALTCNAVLGRKAKARDYAASILRLDPNHAAAREAIAMQPAVVSVIDAKVEEVLQPRDVHALIQLRDLHDVISLILCETLNETRIAQVGRLMEAARSLKVEVPAGSEFEGWETHYRLALRAIDLKAVLAPTPKATAEPKLSLATSDGKALTWRGLQTKAKRLKSRTVFFAAADGKYVDLYARWYVKSILKYCDVSCLVVVHVIGGTGRLKDIAKSLGVASERLVLTADGFDAAGVSTKCYDTPPKGLIPIPVAHFQSVRFLRLGALLQKLQLPVFVSDIDLILQRGVKDLLERAAPSDVMLNENALNTNAGSRLTANLMLVNPTKNAALFLRFLRATLETALAGAEVSRWIDQFALLLARHHLQRVGQDPQIAYFDTASDINNVMYKSYQDHPFRFLSLYHGFDTSSLERQAKVLGAKKARRKT